MKSIFILLFIAVFHYSCAQVSPSAMNDSTLLPPNTIRVKAKILSASESQATVQIVSVVGSGQGIINPLSEGQRITVQLPEGKKIKNGKNLMELHIKLVRIAQDLFFCRNQYFPQTKLVRLKSCRKLES